ncbi:MAG: hypothetical protein NTU61_03935 [Candidatus Altiarchaeota archaeon]|nr:hypothetical protein [Candidatus Altiarchaeota archaeon]
MSLSVITNMKKTLLVLFVICFAISAEALHFEKTSFGNQTDCITQRVCIARGDIMQIYNSALEQKADGASPARSPLGTEWAFGNCANKSSFAFNTFINTSNFYPPGVVGRDMCLHLTEEDLYVDVKFESYGGGDSGGGFSYTRGEVILPQATSTSLIPDNSASAKSESSPGSGFPLLILIALLFVVAAAAASRKRNNKSK